MNRVAIAGAGIGGLTTALMLHQRGIECTVYEQAQEAKEIGVGINALPHALRELRDLGLLEALRAASIETVELHYLNRHGKEVWSELRGTAAGYEVPQLSISRGALHGVLYRAVIERLGESAVHLDSRLTSFEEKGDRVVAEFTSQRGTTETSESELLIGADGIHSVVRSTLFPGEGPPLWSGLMLWRGATPWPKFLDGRSMIIAGGLTEKVIVYPIRELDDGVLTNWVVKARVAEPGSAAPPRQDWSREGRLEDVLSHLQDIQIDQIDLHGLVSSTPQHWEFPMCDRDPLPYWSRGRVTLLGDAAHPMYPVGSNGASQAILDARCLGDQLAAQEDPIAALESYEKERLEATAWIVHSNRTGGPDSVIDEVEHLAPNGFEEVETVLSYKHRQEIMDRYAKKSGFSLDEVGSQSPPAS